MRGRGGGLRTVPTHRVPQLSPFRSWGGTFQRYWGEGTFRGIQGGPFPFSTFPPEAAALLLKEVCCLSQYSQKKERTL